MSTENRQPAAGRDLSQGIPADELREGEALLGELDGESLVLVRSGGRVYAVAAACTHYGGPLAEGLVADGTIRCPWHHACFDLATGRAHAPALHPLAGRDVEERDGRLYVAGPRMSPPRAPRQDGVSTVVAIVGAGAAGSAAATALREHGFSGRVLLIDPDPAAPYDRPNLSKDYLAGTAPADWLPLRSADYWAEQRIERITARVTALDAGTRRLTLDSGDVTTYDRLLLSTGAAPLRPPIPGSERAHVLRTLADCESLIDAAKQAASAVIAGASFIGMEAAAALRARGLAVTIVAPEAVPFERTLGPELGTTLRQLHERNGVTFRLGRTLQSVEPKDVVLDNGERLPADVVLLGIGVRPLLQLAQAAGLEVADGVLVDEFLETSAPGVFAAGDIASWLDAASGERRRVEHWVVAQRQGEAAAINLLGERRPFTDVPFFWTQQYDVAVAYSGYGKSAERHEVDGEPSELDVAVKYYRADRVVALATINRDRENLEFERMQQRGRVEASA